MVKSYFLGGNTPEGFFSYYNHLISRRQAKRDYIIKGGPGTGKSSMMKKVAAWARENGYEADDIHCSSDPDSLVGILIRGLNIAMTDGTSPHITDPVYPACVDEIINMGDCWDAEKIKKARKDIIYYTDAIGEKFREAYRYLAAAGALYGNMMKICGADASETVASAIFEREEIKKSQTGRGRIRKLFASAVTPKGMISYAGTLKSEKTYVLDCKMNIACTDVTDTFASLLTREGYDIECYYDPLMPAEKIKHICVPELGLSLLSSDMYEKVETEKEYTLDIAGMLKNPGQAEKAFEETDALVKEAAGKIKEAKGMHDKLEEYYISGMDFGMAEEKTKKVIAQLETEKHIME